MIALLRICLLLLAAIPFAARAEQQDIAAAARGVVRVAIVATDGSEAYFVGHGSGFAIAPDKVLTNAHVVELTRTEKNLVIGVVPSEGRKSYGGRVIAYSPGNDLALIQLEEGRLPVSTFFAGALADGQHVTAIGYPGNVDRAQGLGLKQMVEPLQTVKTSGTISSGRSSQGFDTILHTAPMAAGNSGGPLVDDCGRVLGVNSFGSMSDGNDAEFGFAVSWREVASFLRQAGVATPRTVVPCRSMAEADAAEAAITQREAQQNERFERDRADKREDAVQRAREIAQQEVISSRENAMAGAAVLLAIAVLAIGAGGLLYSQGRERHASWGIAIGGISLFAALGLFLFKPSFTSIEERVKLPDDDSVVTNDPYRWAGENMCRIDPERSRITVSEPVDLPFGWADGGCVNGDAQYVADGTGWRLTTIPAKGNFVAMSQFDPASGTLRARRWLLDADTMARVRALGEDSVAKGCSSDPATLSAAAGLARQLTPLLPGPPNEKLVYRCQKGRSTPAEGPE